MLLHEVESQANSLIKEWLTEQTWRFEFNKDKKALGRCYGHKRLIVVSKYWVAVLPEIEILDTLKHEIAHAYCAERKICDNHGKNWKEAARKIGAKPMACYKGSIKRPTKYIAKCKCGVEYKTGSLSSRYIFCSFCKTKLEYIDQYAGII